MLTLIAAFAALQQPVAPPTPSRPVVPASPIARVAIQPSEAAVQANDTLRLSVIAYDSAGRVLTNVRTVWNVSGGFFEGRVDSTGLVTGGSPGTLNIAAVVRPTAGGRASVAIGRVTVLPPPAARIAVTPSVTQMYVGQSLVISAEPYAANNDRRYDPVSWQSDRPGVLSIDSTGQLSAKTAGRATITARAGQATYAWPITVSANPVTTIEVTPRTAAVRTGDVVRFDFQARAAGGRAVAGVQPEWLLSPGSGIVGHDGAFVADVPGTYRVVASFAGRTAEAVVTVRPRDAARPATIVGRLPLKTQAAEFWLHPDGTHGYITTISDRIYAINLADPAKPAITDSVVVDARVINDLMTTEDGKFGVLTREGASTRKNGIVVLSFEDPAHPKVISEFTETVTGGVHSTFIYRGHVYLTDDATGSMRVIDISNPYQPKQVARWETPRTEAGRMLHDIDVQDGLAYLSYWNDGLVILDVGNGIKGGSPENPQLVSQYKYDLNALYRDVEAVGGPGFIRGTHTAWRAGRYVFVGDEVFSAKPTSGGVIGLGRAYGRLHVVDVSDILHPRGVAYYEPKDGGTHNVWVAGDTLYLGDYQGGLRVLDISGELQGDLLRQGREVAHVYTGDKDGFTPNTANAWGAVYRNGYIFVPDINSGLWIVKVESKNELTP
jgi:hypothetical protein